MRHNHEAMYHLKKEYPVGAIIDQFVHHRKSVCVNSGPPHGTTGITLGVLLLNL